MSRKLTLVVCQNLEREARAVLETEGWGDVSLFACSALCLRPHDPIVAAQGIEALASRDAGPCQVVGCGGLRELLGGSKDGPAPPRGVMASCFELFAGPGLIAAWIQAGAFLLSPGWLARWQEYIHEWRFDQATARDYFAECIAHLLLLDTGADPQSTKHLQEFAAFVARPFQVVPVGLDYFRLYLIRLVQAWRLDEQRTCASAALGEAQRKLADYATSYDLIGRLTGMKSEAQVISAIFELFTMLFAPAVLMYVPLTETKPGKAQFSPSSAATDPASLGELPSLREEYGWTPSKQGFILRVGESDAAVGVLTVERTAFPQYLQHYLNLGLSLARVCSLAVRNARGYEKLEATIGQLREALANIKTLRGLLPICSGCKKIREDGGYWSHVESYIKKNSEAEFTHGLCPECVKRYFPELEEDSLAPA